MENLGHGEELGFMPLEQIVPAMGAVVAERTVAVTDEYITPVTADGGAPARVAAGEYTTGDFDDVKDPKKGCFLTPL